MRRCTFIWSLLIAMLSIVLLWLGLLEKVEEGIIVVDDCFFFQAEDGIRDSP